MRITAAQRTENENRIRAAMDRLLRGEVPPGGNCDIKTLAREAGIDRTPDPKAAQIDRVFMITSSTIAFRLRIHSRVVAVVGWAAGLLLLFASSSVPWLQLVLPFWVLLVSVNIVILSYRRAD